MYLIKNDQFLNRIPNLPQSIKDGVKTFLKKNPDKGTCNNPRNFSSEEMATKGIASASIICTLYDFRSYRVDFVHTCTCALKIRIQ